MARFAVIAYHKTTGQPFGIAIAAESMMDALFRVKKDFYPWIDRGSKSVQIIELDSWDNSNPERT